MKKIRLMMAGLGDISRFSALGCKLNRKIELCACADIDESRARAFARRFGIAEFFTDFSEMLSEVDADAVYLAVPHHLHFPMIMQALENGLHVFCEKPLTTTLDDGLAVCSAAVEKKLKVGINYQYRYDNAAYALAAAAAGGELGELYYARCNVPWRRDETYFSKSAWHADLAQSGGGALMTQAGHILDICLWAFGGTPKSATGRIAKMKFTRVEVEDLALGIIEMEGGGLIQAAGSMIANPEQPVSIEIYGSRGTGIYKGGILPRTVFKKVRIKKQKPPSASRIHALFASIAGFASWVSDDIPYLTPAAQALPVLAATEALYRSSGNGDIRQVDQRYRRFLNLSSG